MKKRPALFFVNSIIIIVLITLIGCASTEPSRFYMLQSLAGKDIIQKSPATACHVSIGIGPVEIPDYLDRPQIVTRSGPNEMKFAEFDRWAGSLRDNIASVLAENLSLMLSTDEVFLYPWNPALDIDYGINVNILHLDSIPGDHVTLKALWTVSGRKENKELITRVSDIKEKLNASGYNAIVDAISRTFVILSAEIATEIRAIVGKK